MKARRFKLQYGWQGVVLDTHKNKFYMVTPNLCTMTLKVVANPNTEDPSAVSDGYMYSHGISQSGRCRPIYTRTTVDKLLDRITDTPERWEIKMQRDRTGETALFVASPDIVMQFKRFTAKLSARIYKVSEMPHLISYGPIQLFLDLDMEPLMPSKNIVDLMEEHAIEFDDPFTFADGGTIELKWKSLPRRSGTSLSLPPASNT